MIGEPHVNVLKLNMDLDAMQAGKGLSYSPGMASRQPETVRPRMPFWSKPEKEGAAS